jgi:hypothetical protein
VQSTRRYARRMANPGDLDTSFDGNGKKAINFGGTDAARVVLVQPNATIGAVCPDQHRASGLPLRVRRRPGLPKGAAFQWGRSSLGRGATVTLSQERGGCEHPRQDHGHVQEDFR